MRRVSVMVAAALALLLALPALAAAAGGPPDRAQAERALQRVHDLKQGIDVRTGRELTPALAELVQHRSALDASGRRAAARLLARPTDGNSDPQNDGYAPDAVLAAPYCLTNFCVHYVTTTADAPVLTDADADGVPDYVELMATVFENEVMPCENGIAALACDGAPAGLGWPAAPNDGTRGGGPKFDVYLKQLGSQGIFGYVAPDPDQPNDSSLSSYLVMDDDYAFSEYEYPNPEDPLRVTAAHEYNHVLQFGIEAWQDGWMFESTATWAEDKVYPLIDDYVSYLGHWVQLTEQPLTEDAADNKNTAVGEHLKVYGSAVWNHWLSGRHGDDVILQAWDASTDGGGGPIATGSYNSAIVANGGVGFSREFELFSIATAEWRTPASGFPDASYPDIPASERPNLAIGAGATSFQLDHTTFALRNITPPTTGTTVTLNATLPAGLDGAIALVARTGTSTTAGTVTVQPAHTTTGGALSVSLPNANNYGRITAVFVNSDVTQSGWHSGRQDWNWSRDNQSFSNVTVTAGTPPSTATGAATAVTPSSATLNGSVNPNGKATTYYFEYGTTPDYGTIVPVPAGDAGSGSSAIAVFAQIAGLTPGTTYHFRIVASNSDGQRAGSDATFTTAAAPTDPGTGDPGTGSQLAAPAPDSSGSQTPLPTAPALTAAPPAPTISLLLPRQRLRTVLAKGLRMRAGCGTACSMTVRLRLPTRLAKRLKLRPLVATATRRAAAGQTVQVTLRLGRKTRLALGRLRSVRFTVSISAVDPAGRRVQLRRALTVRR